MIVSWWLKGYNGSYWEIIGESIQLLLGNGGKSEGDNEVWGKGQV